MALPSLNAATLPYALPYFLVQTHVNLDRFYLKADAQRNNLYENLPLTCFLNCMFMTCSSDPSQYFERSLHQSFLFLLVS